MPDIFALPELIPDPSLIGNRMLDSVANEHLEALLSHSTSVSLDLARVVHEPDTAFMYIYFPAIDGISTLFIMADGTSAGVSAIGGEGLIGSALTLGVNRTPGQSIVKVQGSAISIEGAQFTDAVDSDA